MTSQQINQPPAGSSPDIALVKAYFAALQDTICQALTQLDPDARFSTDTLTTAGGGETRPRVTQGSAILEKAAVQFTFAMGNALPPAATERNPHLVNRGFQASAISLIIHPRNPYAPTTHMNLRFFQVPATPEDAQQYWYFGGGFDLTPYYGFTEDAVHWHEQAQAACAPFGEHLYAQLKHWCDEYFYLPHRQEQRGIGGLFFDDWDKGGFEQAFALVRSVGEHFLPAYLPILKRRMHMPYTDRERNFQLYRRGRYAEFNLAIDRGTRYGLESGRRIESVLASLPPLASWQYDWSPQPGSPEAELYERFIKQPGNWLQNSG